MPKATQRDGSDIPASELEVLSALWRLGTGTGREVLEELGTSGRRLAYTTVVTLLGRLEGRGYVTCDRSGTAHIFRPRISRERVAAERLDHLVRQLGEGRAAPLILKLFETHELSRDDIRELRAMLQRLETDGRAEDGT
jgi:predicted transcriptional regulator